MSIKNSIIVPAYNEEKRSMGFLPLLIDFVKKYISNSEIIIVDDGSTDDTLGVIKKLIDSKKAKSFVRVVGYKQNQGKGNAVAYGVKLAKGQKIVFIDADGSILPNEIPKMLKRLDEFEFVAGDRLSKKSKVKTKLIRRLFSFGFNSLVSVLFQYSLRDNLCGFKGFQKNVAKKLFHNLKDKRWVFDVELFFKAKRLGYSTYFLPIEWHHVSGSKIKLLIDPAKWAIRLVKLRFELI